MYLQYLQLRIYYPKSGLIFNLQLPGISGKARSF